MKEKLYSARDLYQSIIRQIHQHKNETYTIEESRYMALMLIEHYLHYQRNDILVDRQIQLNSHQKDQLEKAVARICNDEPIQYVIGETFFYGRSFYVTPAALIPRRETEELTDIVVKENLQEGLKVLDIGTGSGCIAITLSKELNSAKVHALDASQEALAVAKANAQRHQAEILWYLEDILDPTNNFNSYDLVVSNPPYVRRSEIQAMKKNVLDFEPHKALFVSDEDPLLFYRQIASLCSRQKLLRNKGRLYFEINEAYGMKVAELLEEYGFTDVLLRKDMQQKDRFISAKLTF
ncbi:release factor glutamine methyltransferase [Catalinimonas alkaloidigena]|uniref:peptide chain release factor N(5)-glutamine methyltransferase n=1 Tax=Catalinimonas alkaloidigena TaxID=1075417 RepID=UPI0024064859|nr:peptide chain release factor N(5)-glutamine methyltransferase [Catalinimonas alkaloidigena]MDF9800578.1 release factor glutamine methyltransferase [Catalinimonas alkaloidigena]